MQARILYLEKGIISESAYNTNMLGLILLSITLYAIFIYVKIFNRTANILLSIGIHTKATILKIINTRTGHSLCLKKIFHTHYEYFDEPGHQYTKICRFLEENYNQFQQDYVSNSQFEVIYDPKQPTRCLPVFRIQ